jgi:glucose/arabinose dehydrogenase
MRILRLVIAVAVVLGLLLLVFLEPIKRAAVVLLSLDYVVEGAPIPGARFDSVDARHARLDVDVAELAAGFEQPVELAFVPGDDSLLLVAEKGGALRWVDLWGGARGELLRVEVLTASEQGLLGFALHPGFADNGRLFVNYTARRGGAATVVQEWTVPVAAALRAAAATPGPVLLEVAQPYPNHNGGQLLFGPDGTLFVPLGDGGLKNDPFGNGQDLTSKLGAILRLDVDLPAPHVPPDNPFVGTEGADPAIWAYGVRNPWRCAFDPDGRLIVADVGQDTWEEVGFARAGASLGWNGREATHCFPPGVECEPPVDDEITPFWEVQHPIGLSITGGVVATGRIVPALRGRYVVGDFAMGRLWALPVPDDDRPIEDGEVLTLGTWDALPVSFTLGPDGAVVFADYGRGRILRIQAAGPAPNAPEGP